MRGKTVLWGKGLGQKDYQYHPRATVLDNFDFMEYKLQNLVIYQMFPYTHMHWTTIGEDPLELLLFSISEISRSIDPVSMGVDLPLGQDLIWTCCTSFCSVLKIHFCSEICSIVEWMAYSHQHRSCIIISNKFSIRRACINTGGKILILGEWRPLKSSIIAGLIIVVW